jgi:hypothetical protein
MIAAGILRVALIELRQAQRRTPAAVGVLELDVA